MHLLAIKLLCFMVARSVVRKVTCDVWNNAHNILRRRRSTKFVPVNTINITTFLFGLSKLAHASL